MKIRTHIHKYTHMQTQLLKYLMSDFIFLIEGERIKIGNGVFPTFFLGGDVGLSGMVFNYFTFFSHVYIFIYKI